MKIENFRKNISKSKFGGYIARENARYLSETPAAEAVVITENETIIITNRMNLDRARKESEIKKVKAFAKTKIPTRKGENLLIGPFGEVIGNILKELEISSVGYDYLKGETRDKIQKNFEVNLVKEPDLIWKLRRRKTSKEIEKLRKSAKIASKGMKKAKDVIEPGISEIEVAAEVEYEMRMLGSEGTPFDTIVASGENSLYPHMSTTGKKIGKNELITVDLGARWEGYCSDMTRTFSINPSEKQEKVIDLVKKSQEKALEKVEAGVDCSDIDKAGREVFKDDLEKFYLHGIGHGVGLNIHEAPNLSPSSEDVLEKNMVITIEPGIYVDEIGGCRFEDTIVVEEDGYEKLTSL